MIGVEDDLLGRFREDLGGLGGTAVDDDAWAGPGLGEAD